jgi:minor tail protein
MALSEVIARLGFQLDDAALKKGVAGLDGFMSKLQQMGQIIAGSVVLGAVKNFVGEMTKVGGELIDQSNALGVATDELQRWRHAAKLNGVEAGELGNAFRVLQQRQVDASKGGKESKEAFEKLGVSLKDGNGQFKSADRLLEDVGDGLDGLGSNAEKVAIAQQLLGRSGSKLLPVFKGGADAIRKNLDALDDLGGVLSEETIATLDEAGDAADRFDAAMLGLKASLATAVFPLLASGINKVAEWVGTIKKAAEGTNFWKAALAAVGVVAIGPLIGLLKTLAAAAALPALKFAFLVLVIDDLMTLFAGGESLIGKALDKIFGAGASNTAVKALKGIWSELAEHDWAGAAQAIANAFDSMGEAIVNAVAGQDLDDAISQHMAETGESFGSVLMNGIIAGLEGAFAFIAENVSDPILNAIQSAYTAVADTALELGRQVIDWIVEGLVAGASKIVDAITSPFRDSLPAVRKVWDANSPSREAMKIIQDIGAGAEVGGERAAPSFARAFNAVLPGPQQRAAGNATVQQTNHMQISVGAGGVAGAQLVGRSVGENTRTWLQEAAGALLATG